MRLAALLCLLALPAAAQNRNCAPHAILVERLAAGYGESRQAVALGSGGEMVETFANLDSGSWTVTVTQPGGLTCLVASGQAFELTVTPPAPMGDDS